MPYRLHWQTQLSYLKSPDLHEMIKKMTRKNNAPPKNVLGKVPSAKRIRPFPFQSTIRKRLTLNFFEKKSIHKIYAALQA